MERWLRLNIDNRKKSLKRKAHDLSILCGVDVCILYNESDKNPTSVWPEDLSEARRMAVYCYNYDKHKRGRKRQAEEREVGEKKQRNKRKRPTRPAAATTATPSSCTSTTSAPPRLLLLPPPPPVPEDDDLYCTGGVPRVFRPVSFMRPPSLTTISPSTTLYPIDDDDVVMEISDSPCNDPNPLTSSGDVGTPTTVTELKSRHRYGSGGLNGFLDDAINIPESCVEPLLLLMDKMMGSSELTSPPPQPGLEDDDDLNCTGEVAPALPAVSFSGAPPLSSNSQFTNVAEDGARNHVVDNMFMNFSAFPRDG